MAHKCENTMKYKSILVLNLLFLSLVGSGQTIQRWNSGGKLNPLQANMDIRHYTISLDVDIAHQSINGR